MNVASNSDATLLGVVKRWD